MKKEMKKEMNREEIISRISITGGMKKILIGKHLFLFWIICASENTSCLFIA